MGRGDPADSATQSAYGTQHRASYGGVASVWSFGYAVAPMSCLSGASTSAVRTLDRDMATIEPCALRGSRAFGFSAGEQGAPFKAPAGNPRYIPIVRAGSASAASRPTTFAVDVSTATMHSSARPPFQVQGGRRMNSVDGVVCVSASLGKQSISRNLARVDRTGPSTNRWLTMRPACSPLSETSAGGPRVVGMEGER